MNGHIFPKCIHNAMYGKFFKFLAQMGTQVLIKKLWREVENQGIDGCEVIRTIKSQHRNVIV